MSQAWRPRFHIVAAALVGIAACCASLGAQRRASAATPPPPQPIPGFTQTLLASGLHNPVVLAFAPNGDLWIGCQGGDIHVLHNGTLLPTPVISLGTDSTAELGLLGLTFDPNFATNGYFYVSYTTSSQFTQLSRFTAVNNVASPSSELVLLRGTQQQTQFGPGNDLQVGPDGKLWWSVGGNPYPWGNSQTLTNIYGKIIRINLDGSVPADNPFVDVPGAVPYIYAWGLRNPFRFTFLPDGRMLTADTGSSYWEEFDAIAPGANYGWPVVEGACGSCGYVNPVYAYGHVPNDGAVSAVLAYHGATFPNAYDHVVFFGDYNRQDIEAVSFDPTYHTEISDTVFDANAGTISDLVEGPDGDLYYPGIYEGKVWRIAATGPFPPTAVAAATPSAGTAPLTVQLSSAGSSDPYSLPLSYSWNFGDGTPTSTSPNPSHVYTANGTYTATLTVSDGSSSGTATTTVTVGRTPPSAAITSPSANSTYTGGETIAFSGSASDQVDGVLPPSAYAWRVDYHANGVTQPFYLREAPEPFYALSGATGGSFTVPNDVTQQPGSFYSITLTVTNSAGIATTTSETIQPQLTSWTVSSNVSGTGFFVDGAWQTASDTVQDVAGVQHVLSGGPTQVINGQRYRFAGWADGSALTDTFTSSATAGATYTAEYEPVTPTLPGGWQATDVGAPLMSGETDYAPASSSFYQDGGGIDIGGASEQFHLTYQTLSGDGTIVARVRYQTNTNPYAKAGVMIKQNTTAGSPYAAIAVTPGVSPNTPNISGVNCTANGCDAPLDPVTPAVGHGIRFQASNGTDVAVTSPTTLAGFADPDKWLKLQRSGSTFTAFFSTDGSTWQQIGSTTVSVTGPVLVGLFDVGHENHLLETAAFDDVTLSSGSGPPPPMCPAGWTCQDIGNPALAGSATASGGVWTIQGAGSDIHGSADQFQFDYQSLAGNGSTTARISAQSDTNAWAKAGVMLRAGTDPGAVDYALLVTPGNGVVVQYRGSAGGSTVRIAQLSGTVPVYLRVSRSGSSFSAYTSSDGSSWTLVPGSTVTLNVSGAMLEGLAVSSHNTAALCTVTADNVTTS